MMTDYFRNDRQFDEYQVGGLQERHNAMNESFMNGQYGEAVNYARALIESTCKYIYHELSDKEIEEDKGHKTRSGEYMIGLKTMISECLKLLQSLMTYPKDLNCISSNIGDIVTIIGKVRNSSALSHGSRHRNIPIQKAEARYIISVSEDVCLLLMDLLYERTVPRKKNCIGAIINTEGLHKYGNAYQTENNTILNVRFETNGKIVYMIVLTFSDSINLDIDSELVNKNIKQYLPDDIKERKEVGENEYEYYSDKQDNFYRVELVKTSNLLVYISERNDYI